LSFQVLIRRRAAKSLGKLPQGDYDRIREAIVGLAEDPRPPGASKLSARDGWRIRVGRYRVLYDIQDDARSVVVLDVGHRRDIYR